MKERIPRMKERIPQPGKEGASPAVAPPEPTGMFDPHPFPEPVALAAEPAAPVSPESVAELGKLIDIPLFPPEPTTADLPEPVQAKLTVGEAGDGQPHALTSTIQSQSHGDAQQQLESPVHLAQAQSEDTEAGWLPTSLQWVWGVLQGDFNEDPSTSQIIVRTLITLIPGLDQAADIQDVVAALYKLAWQKRYDEVGPWFDLLITSIGLIPTAGSALKGVFKWLKRSAGNIDLSALRRLLEPLGINLDRFIRDFPDYITAATAQGKGFIANLANQVTATKNTLRRYIRFDPTGKLSQLISKLDEFSRSLDEILARIDEKFREIGEEIQRQLDELLGGLETANGAPVPGRGQEIDQGPMRMEGSHEGGSRINSNRLDGRSGLNLPQGLTDLQFSDLSTAVRARAAELGLGEDIVV